MRSPSISGRPICQACNRPFDPSVPGATLTMGPTCAKRAGVSRAVYGGGGQLALGADEELLMGLTLESESTKVQGYRAKSSAPRAPTRRVPKPLSEMYELAKIAFDDLFRVFCGGGLLYGPAAWSEHEKLLQGSSEIHALDDPSLGWLEPERDLCLIFDRDNRTVYYWRVLDGTYTLLAVDPRHSPEVRSCVKAIVDYSVAVRAHREAEGLLQLELSGLGFTD